MACRLFGIKHHCWCSLKCTIGIWVKVHNNNCKKWIQTVVCKAVALLPWPHVSILHYRCMKSMETQLNLMLFDLGGWIMISKLSYYLLVRSSGSWPHFKQAFTPFLIHTYIHNIFQNYEKSIWCYMAGPKRPCYVLSRLFVLLSQK